MKQDMFDFLLHVAFPNAEGLELAGFRQRAPHGHIVYGPKHVPKHMRPMFPGHQTYPHRPELHQRYSPVFAGAARTVIPPLLVAYPFVTATAQYPQVAGKQYQSSITGQPTASDPNLLFGGKQGLSYFKFY